MLKQRVITAVVLLPLAMAAIFLVSAMPPAWMMSGWMMFTARFASTSLNSNRV